MYQKTFALTVRSLRVDTRQLTPHLMRAGLSLFILMHLVSAQQSFSTQAPGFNLFRWIVYTNAVFASLVVPLLFSSSITEEKEERTLPLLMIAGVTPLTILLGKSLPRLLSILAIFIVQIPFSLLAVTLGGVLFHQVLACYIALVAYIFFIAALSLWCSVIFRITANSMGLAGLLVLAYHGFPAILYGTFSFLVRDPTWGPTARKVVSALGFHWETHIFSRIGVILTSGFDERILSKQVGINLMFGIAFFVFAWCLFPLCHREPDNVSSKRLSKSSAARRSRRRAWKNALTWKEFYFLAGGKLYIAGKLILYSLLIGFIAIVAAEWDLKAVRLVEVTPILASLFLFVFLPIETIFTVGRSFAPEVKDKTLSSLVLLPVSTRRLAYSKLAGGVLGLLPVVILLLGTLAMDPVLVTDTLDRVAEYPLESSITILNLVGHFVLYLHLVVWMSLQMSTWWAIIVSGLVHYFSVVVVWVLFALTWTTFDIDVSDELQYAGGYAAALTVFAVSGALHFNIGTLIKTKAAGT